MCGHYYDALSSIWLRIEVPKWTRKGKKEHCPVEWKSSLWKSVKLKRKKCRNVFFSLQWNIIDYSWLDTYSVYLCVCLWICKSSEIHFHITLLFYVVPKKKRNDSKVFPKVAMCFWFTASNSFDCHNQCYCLKWKDNKRSYLHKLRSHSNRIIYIWACVRVKLSLFFCPIPIFFFITMRPFCSRLFLDFDYMSPFFIVFFLFPAYIYLPKLIFCDCFFSSLFRSKYPKQRKACFGNSRYRPLNLRMCDQQIKCIYIYFYSENWKHPTGVVSVYKVRANAHSIRRNTSKNGSIAWIMVYSNDFY